MSAKKRDISREEMRQYLEGKLKRKAAHEVERHLLENEFANDAMEGFEGFDQDLILRAFGSQHMAQNRVLLLQDNFERFGCFENPTPLAFSAGPR